jgi:beta-catenin-like protein 1
MITSNPISFHDNNNSSLPLGLELLVQNLSRLDESNDEDAQGVNSSMGCIENLVEIRPNIAVLICERTHILKFLILRLKVLK